MRTKTKFTFNFVLFVHFLSNVSKDQLYIIYIFNFVCTRISWSSENLSAWFEKKKKKKRYLAWNFFLKFETDQLTCTQKGIYSSGFLSNMPMVILS